MSTVKWWKQPSQTPVTTHYCDVTNRIQLSWAENSAHMVITDGNELYAKSIAVYVTDLDNLIGALITMREKMVA